MFPQVLVSFVRQRRWRNSSETLPTLSLTSAFTQHLQLRRRPLTPDIRLSPHTFTRAENSKCDGTDGSSALQLRLRPRSGIMAAWRGAEDSMHGGGKEGAGHPADLPMWITPSGTSLFHLNYSPLPDSETHPHSTAPQTVISKPKVCDFWIIWIKFPLYQHALLRSSKKKLTGLLIQSMSALSDRDSSGPKSVTGWASTLELCFLLSMLKLALVSKYESAVWKKKDSSVSHLNPLYPDRFKTGLPHVCICIR